MTEDYEVSSGNVFADLRLPNPGQEFVRVELTLQISALIASQGLTQKEAGNLLGVKQPVISSLINRKPSSMSVGKMMELLAALGQNVEIRVGPAQSKANLQKKPPKFGVANKGQVFVTNWSKKSRRAPNIAKAVRTRAA